MEELLKVSGAIYDETRIKILKFILENGEVCVCDIENSFNMVQSRVSRHLKILKEAKLLSVDRKGRWAYYTIRDNLDKLRVCILDEIDSLNIKVPPLVHNCKVEH